MAVKTGRTLRIILYIAIGLVIIGFIYAKFFRGSPESSYITAVATRGNIEQTVSVVGSTESQVRYSLQFALPGILDAVLVKEGEKVKAGDILAKLENGDLAIQLEAQNSALRIAQANLAKALAGPRNEELNLNRLKVDLAQQDYNTAVKGQYYLSSIAQGNLESSRIALDQASQNYNAAMQALAALANNDQTGRLVGSSSTGINSDVTGFIDNYIPALNDYFDAQNQQQAAQNKAAIDQAQNAVAQAQLALTQAQNNYQKAAYDYNRQLNDLNTNINKANIGVQSAQEQYNLAQAKPRETDVGPLKAQINQAWDGVHLAQYRLDQAQLKAPANGVVSKINYHVGEVVSSVQPFMVLDSDGFYVKALVSEADIAKIKSQQSVTMTFDALDSSLVFNGVVAEIATAETVLQGVIYYQVKVLLQNPNEQIKPGMTANLIINTQSKSGVLSIPIRAVQYEGNQAYVQVLMKDSSGKDQVEKRNITTGIQGDENIEVLSGLQEGDQVVTFTKNQ